MRQKILKELLQNRDSFISGSQLGERLGISRVAIWKHIEALKEEGYDINGVSGRGYQLEDSGIIIPDEIMAGLPQQLIGSQIYYYPRLDSTNEALKRCRKVRYMWLENKKRARDGGVENGNPPPVDYGFPFYCDQLYLYPRRPYYH